MWDTLYIAAVTPFNSISFTFEVIWVTKEILFDLDTNRQTTQIYI